MYLKERFNMNALAQPVFSAEEAMLKLNEVDLSHVKASCLLHGHYSTSEIDQVADEYKKYIALAVSNGLGGLPISRKLDEFLAHTYHLHAELHVDVHACCRALHPSSSEIDG